MARSYLNTEKHSGRRGTGESETATRMKVLVFRTQPCFFLIYSLGFNHRSFWEMAEHIRRVDLRKLTGQNLRKLLSSALQKFVDTNGES